MPPPYFVSSPNPPSTDPGTVLFETERLVVRRPHLADAPAIAAAANFASIAAVLRDRFPFPYTTVDAVDFIKRMRPVDDGSAAFPLNTVVCLKPFASTSSDGNSGNENSDDKTHAEENGTCKYRQKIIGGLSFEHSTDVRFRSWEIGYWLTPSVTRRGYGLELVRSAVGWAFGTWPDLYRIEAVVSDNNPASRGLLLKAGFTEEGISRGAVFKNGQILNEFMLGILRSDLEIDGVRIGEEKEGEKTSSNVNGS